MEHQIHKEYGLLTQKLLTELTTQKKKAPCHLCGHVPVWRIVEAEAQRATDKCGLLKAGSTFLYYPGHKFMIPDAMIYQFPPAEINVVDAGIGICRGKN